MAVNDTDKFIVNRSNSSYSLEAQNLMAELLDDDLMLVNRNGKSYKATGAEIKESLKPPAEVIKPQIIAPADGAGEMVAAESDEIITVDSRAKTLQKVEYHSPTGGPGILYGFEIDGKVLDAGDEPNYAQTSVLNCNRGIKNPERAFNGGLTNGAESTTTSTTTDYVYTWTPSKTWVVNDFTVWGYAHNPSNNNDAHAIAYWTDGTTTRYDDDGSKSGLYAFIVNEGGTTLTLAGDKDLTAFQPLDDVQQDDGAATGTISSIDVAAKTITLSASSGTWSANTGNYVRGEETPSQDAAPDPSGVNFVGSKFQSSDGSLTAGSADWQVAALADTGYTSPISQVTGHPEMTPSPTWTSDALEGETGYRARTKYKAATGEESPWSDDVTFKTAKGVDDVTATPGVLWEFTDAQDWQKIDTPALCVNFASSSTVPPAKVAITIEGGVAATDDIAGTTLTYGGSTRPFPGAGSNVIDLWSPYTGAGTYSCVGLRNDGTTFKVSPTQLSELTIPGGAERLISFGGVKNMVGAISKDKKLYCLGLAAHKLGSQALGVDDTWVEVPIGLPAGKSIQQIAAVTSNGYDAEFALVLDTDGELWEIGTSTYYANTYLDNKATNTNANPKKVSLPLGDTGKVRAIATAAASYKEKWSYSILMANGNLYAEQGSGALCFGTGVKQITLIGGGFMSCVIGAYGKKQWLAGGTDGDIYTGFGSFATVNTNQPPGHTSFSSLGSAPGRNNALRAPLVIIPTT